MKTTFVTILILFSSHIYGKINNGRATCESASLSDNLVTSNYSWANDPSKITKEVISKLTTLYLSEKYEECIDCCKNYIGHRWLIGHKNHPYRDRFKLYDAGGDEIESIATVLYLGSISTYTYSLTNRDKSIVDGIEWSRACAVIYNDYLHENVPDKSWTAEMMYNYILNGEKGQNATQCGEHLLKALGNDSWGKKERKWFEKTSDEIYDILVKNTSDKESLFSEYPLLQYKISTINSNQLLKKGKFRTFKDVFSRRVEALTKLIQQDEQNNYKTDIHVALNSLTSMLCSTVIESEICKKIGDDYERFCMENLIKLQDLSYCQNGSSRYSQSVDYTLRDIQNRLEDTDCAILHFEAPVASGQYYFRDDLGTIYRNYALLITKDQATPEVWHRGYIKNDSVNNLDKIKESHPNIKRFFYVGTPRMSFIDIAGTDSSIVRLHSLSQLLQERKESYSDCAVTFIGDINYDNASTVIDTEEDEMYSVTKGGRENEKFDPLRGSAVELEHIEKLYPNVHSVCGDDATRSVVTSEISRSRGIVHISTHGELFDSNYDDYINSEDLILKRNIMDNSCLILSDYNDAPESPLSVLSGSDVLRMKKIDSSIVFLDACVSGQGEMGVSGSVGIAEAFHLIGAKNVICYLEDVNDGVATEFSNRFYLELSKGASCHDAFFTAKKSITKKIKVVLWE